MDKKREQAIRLEKQLGEKENWRDFEKSAKINESLKAVKEEIQFFQKALLQLEEIKEISSLIRESPDKQLEQELHRKIQELNRKIQEKETELFLSDPYDKRNAIVSIYAGAGGIDAQEWAGRLLKMYQKFSEKKKWRFELVSKSFGEQGGVKEATFQVKGKFAYGLLKQEAGVHRLVRISPFSAQRLRHTSFALVEVLPDISLDREIEIDPNDLKVATFHSGGPGGQNVNKRETAVRITHLPTGISVSSQAQRSLEQNRQKAMGLLKLKLFYLMQLEHKKTLQELKTKSKPQWGSQIRSYVMHPYHLVKDLRSGWQEQDVERVLAGNIENFINAQLKEGKKRSL